MKTCYKCNQIKPLSDFYFRKDTQTHRNECKYCTKAAKAIRESVPGVKELRAEKEKQRRVLHKEKINSTLWKQRNQPEAKERIKLQTKKYKLENPAKVAAHAHNARIRRHNTIIQNTCTKQEFSDWYVTADPICTYCGKTSIKLTVDHIEPLVNGGSHTPDNFAIACISCNSSKNATPLLIWMAKLTNRSRG